MRFLVIQPHLDDAFFSITETALTWAEDGHEVHLLTVFGGLPPVGNERRQKHITMWEEYEAAVKAGPFKHYYALDELDDAARPPLMRPTSLELARRLEPEITRFGPRSIIVWPKGIHHPDHLLVDRARLDMGRGDWCYDELPYFVMYPHEAIPDGCGLQREGSRSHLEAKRLLCAKFESQMGETEERCLWAPERVWRPR